MKKSLLLPILLVSAFTVFAQQQDGTIKIRHGFFGTRYYQGAKKMNMSQVAEAMRENVEAYKLMKAARTNNILYYALSITGGIMLGYGMPALYLFKLPGWELIIPGAALTVTSFVLYYKSKNQAESAVEMYNNDLRKTSSHSSELKLHFRGNGLALAFHF